MKSFNRCMCFKENPEHHVKNKGESRPAGEHLMNKELR